MFFNHHADVFTSLSGLTCGGHYPNSCGRFISIWRMFSETLVADLIITHVADVRLSHEADDHICTRRTFHLHPINYCVDVF